MRIHDLTASARTDERGWAVRLLDAAGLDPGSVGDVHVVSVEPGTVRGNHVHDRGREWLLLCGGPVRAAWRAGGSVHRRDFPGERPILFEIPPGVSHAFQNLGERTTHLVALVDDADFPTRRLDAPLLP